MQDPCHDPDRPDVFCSRFSVSSLNTFLEAFLPLFVAVNVLGILPLFIGLTDGMTDAARRRLAVQAVTTAFAVAVLILFAGQFIFRVMGITLNDLRVGGGLILLVLSISDLLFGDYRRRAPDADESAGNGVGIVPIGIPLIIGPAAITTILVLQQSHNYLPTLASLVTNLGLVLVIFLFGPALLARLGESTAKAVAKVASLFLAAIAVAMIRAGVVGMIEMLG
jgi:multiple antibiotic resistance protein